MANYDMFRIQTSLGFYFAFEIINVCCPCWIRAELFYPVRNPLLVLLVHLSGDHEPSYLFCAIHIYPAVGIDAHCNASQTAAVTEFVSRFN